MNISAGLSAHRRPARYTMDLRDGGHRVAYDAEQRSAYDAGHPVAYGAGHRIAIAYDAGGGARGGAAGDPGVCALMEVANPDVPRWEHFAHDADMGVRGVGSTLAEAFEQGALALTALITDL